MQKKLEDFEDIQPLTRSKVLLQDSVQSVEEITNTLNARVLPEPIKHVVDQSKKYTIEDIYKNELEYRKQQIEANDKIEKTFIKKQVDGKVETYYKGSDTYSNLLCSELNVVNGLLDDLEQHKLFVQVKFFDKGIELMGEKQRLVKRDGVLKTEIEYLHPITVSIDLLENKTGEGYKLSFEKLKENEQQFHDKQTLNWKNKDTQGAEPEKQEQQDEQSEDVEEVEEVEQVEEQTQQPEPKVEQQPEPKNIQPKVLGIEQEGVQNIINNLGDFAGNEVFKEESQSGPKLDWFDSLLDDVYDSKQQTIQPKQEQEIEEQVVQQAQQDDETDDFDYDDFEKFMNDEEEQEALPPVKEKHMFLTEHDMKIQNFQRAADEIKQKIIDCYGGNTERAKQDEDYIRLEQFVETTIQKQNSNIDLNQPIEDWMEPDNNLYMQEDLEAKRESFAKRYGNDVFARINARA